MASKLVSVSILVALCGAICQAAPATEGPFDDCCPFAHSILRIKPEKLEEMVDVDADTLDLYADLVKCYTGTVQSDNEHLHQFCQAHKDQLLASYFHELSRRTGRSLLVPLEFYKMIEPSEQHIDPKIFSSNWYRSGERMVFADYCKRMVWLVDEGFGQWGYDSKTVVEYFKQKLQQPIGKVLEVCRRGVEVSV